MPDAVVVPSLGVIARHAVPNIIEGKIVPSVLFLAALSWHGTTTALLVALGWSLVAAGRHRGQG